MGEYQGQTHVGRRVYCWGQRVERIAEMALVAGATEGRGRRVSADGRPAAKREARQKRSWCRVKLQLLNAGLLSRRTGQASLAHLVSQPITTFGTRDT